MATGRIQKEPIENGYVVKIINEYTIAVNKGNKFLSVGDILEIVEESAKITDPITHKTLGTFEFVKAKVRVTEVHDYFSICKGLGSTSKLASSSFIQALGGSSHVQLNVNNDENDSLSLEKTEISLKDKFRLV